MARCTKKSNLDVHHKRKDGGNGLENAEVLCEACHMATYSFGTHNPSPLPFLRETKEKALERAGNQCECTKTGGCH